MTDKYEESPIDSMLKSISALGGSSPNSNTELSYNSNLVTSLHSLIKGHIAGLLSLKELTPQQVTLLIALLNTPASVHKEV
jgi:hypothetical protein